MIRPAALAVGAQRLEVLLSPRRKDVAPKPLMIKDS
jgi:hypothetical protein